MAVKTFNSGEVLTASDTNTYLANSGLVYITTSTVGSAVTSVSVSNCFSSTYDNYRILVTSVAGSTNAWMYFNVNGNPQGWYGNLSYANFASGGVATVGMSNATFCNYVGGCINSTFDAAIELRAPYLSKPTFLSAPYIDGINAGQTVGCLSNTTSYTGLYLAVNSGTMTGGTITVYGYRKA